MLHDGVTVKLGGKDYVLPPLTMKQLRDGMIEKIRQHDEMLTDNKTFEAHMLRAEIIGSALKRNYPELTDDEILDLITMRNWLELWQITLGGVGEGNSGQADSPPSTTSGPSTDS